MKKINFLPASVRTLVKGLIVAVIGAVVAVVAPSLENGQFVFDWTTIWHTAVAAGIAYIGKNVVSPTPKVVQIDPSKTSVVDKTTKDVIVDSGNK
jgi:hypothetical protein